MVKKIGRINFGVKKLLRKRKVKRLERCVLKKERKLKDVVEKKNRGKKLRETTLK